MEFLGIGSGEIILILVLAILIFKPAKVVEMARGLGKMIRAFKKTTSEVTSSISREIDEEKSGVSVAESRDSASQANSNQE